MKRSLLILVISVFCSSLSQASQEATVDRTVLRKLKAYDPQFKGFGGRLFYTDGKRLFRSTQEGLAFEILANDEQKKSLDETSVDLSKVSCKKVQVNEKDLLWQSNFVIDKPKWERGDFTTFVLTNKQGGNTVVLRYRRFYQPGFTEFRVLRINEKEKRLMELCRSYSK